MEVRCRSMSDRSAGGGERPGGGEGSFPGVGRQGCTGSKENGGSDENDAAGAAFPHLGLCTLQLRRVSDALNRQWAWAS